MSVQTIDRPRLDEPPVDDMPPLDIIKCQCEESCPFSDQCANEATDDDMLCNECRKAAENLRQFKSGVFSANMMMVSDALRAGLKHCHECDPEFTEGNTDAPS